MKPKDPSLKHLENLEWELQAIQNLCQKDQAGNGARLTLESLKNKKLN